jgi:hypothetical protein
VAVARESKMAATTDFESKKLPESDLKELMKHKTVILNFVDQIETLVLVSVVISNSNGKCPYTFTDAYVEHSRSGSYVFYKTLFKIEILKHVIEKGVLPDELGARKRNSVLYSLTLLARYLSGMTL